MIEVKSNLLTITPGQSFARGVASATRVSLTTADADSLASAGRLLSAVVPAMQGQLQLKYGAHNINTTIVGTSANYQVVQRVDIAYGRSFTNGDDAARVAAVSLIVGGIGIMNIMLVSVSERTREIGLRKAVGATRSDFLFQFLTEALMLCFAGGLVGVALGAGASVLLGRTFHWNMLISPQAIALSFGFSALVGAFFGLWPARGAAQLDPIESLRYE